jgi:hypothetical protein
MRNANQTVLQQADRKRYNISSHSCCNSSAHLLSFAREPSDRQIPADLTFDETLVLLEDELNMVFVLSF